MESCDDDKVPCSKTSLSVENEGQRNQAEGECDPKIEPGLLDLNQPSVRKRKHQEVGPGSSCLSFKDDQSMSDIINFKVDHPSDAKRKHQEVGPGSSCLSFKDDQSMSDIINFKVDHPSDAKRLQQSSEVGEPLYRDQMPMGAIFVELEKEIQTFVKKELKEILKALSSNSQECLEGQKKEEAVFVNEDEKQRSSKEAFLKITVYFLRRMKQDKLAELLESKSLITCQHALKSNLKKSFHSVFEGIAKSGNQTLLNQIYTELYITEEGTGDVNSKHEICQIEKVSWRPDRPDVAITHGDIFKPIPQRDKPIRTVMTKGVAGIGKTVLTQKFTLDWAENQTNQDVDFTFPFTFRELNLLKGKKFSLVELVHHFFSETKGIHRFEDLKVVFIFDGLDECRLSLDFHNNEILRDVTMSTSVDVLLTNLIRGNLLPSAHLWITTRPAAATRIPSELVCLMTEIRGFTDPQKDQYFTKRFTHKQAKKVIFHIKKSRTIHIMCHIPIFCWITATVMEDMMTRQDGEELPNTLTQMYIYFLVVQAEVKKRKYDIGAKTDSPWKMIESLGKLAFEQLLKRNILFYETDLTECGIDIQTASVCSGVFTQIFRKERGMYQKNVFCFIHLSVQEFLAALHVHLTFIKSGSNLLAKDETKSGDFEKGNLTTSEIDLYKSAVDMALESPDGHLDLFLRFLLGLSLDTNRCHLRGLLVDTDKQTDRQRQAGEDSVTNKETAQYIKEKLNDHLCVEKSINLFHCLNELNDQSLVEEIQQSLTTGSLSAHQLSAAQWSALHFILLFSEKVLNVFDLKKYSASEEALQRLLPIVNATSKAILSGCNLSERSCEALSSLLCSTTSSLRDLDLSNNNLTDLGINLLCEGLKSPDCKLETLRFSGCLITEKGCDALISALISNSSHLKELDLSFNHLGEAGISALINIQKNPSTKLQTLRIEPAGDRWLTPGMKKYYHPLTLDLNTVNKYLKLSDKNKKVTRVEEEQLYPDHPDRFDLYQLLCTNALTGRCYWEVEWSGRVDISVSYRGIIRKGDNDDSWFGFNDHSWSLICSDDGYTVWHNHRKAFIPCSFSPSVSKRVAVYLDFPAGTLSFYRVSSDTLIHLYSFNTTFTEPLYPGFGFEFRADSWVSLCLP